jgi:hypothetical protein
MEKQKPSLHLQVEKGTYLSSSGIFRRKYGENSTFPSLNYPSRKKR